jgi:hypothetical protein
MVSRRAPLRVRRLHGTNRDPPPRRWPSPSHLTQFTTTTATTPATNDPIPPRDAICCGQPQHPRLATRLCAAMARSALCERESARRLGQPSAQVTVVPAYNRQRCTSTSECRASLFRFAGAEVVGPQEGVRLSLDPPVN